MDTPFPLTSSSSTPRLLHLLSFFYISTPRSLSLSQYHCVSNGELSRNWVEDSVPSTGMHHGCNSRIHTRHWWLSFPHRTSLTVLSLLHCAFFTLFLIIPNPSSYFCLPASLFSVLIQNRAASVVLFMYLLIICVYFSLECAANWSNIVVK